MRNHPDKNGNTFESNEKFKKISEAYTYLKTKVIQENFPVDLIPIGTHQFWTYINNYNLSDRTLFINHINKLITLIGL